jgi:hypothetical protein
MIERNLKNVSQNHKMIEHYRIVVLTEREKTDVDDTDVYVI